jgi:hypothetical protein
MPVMIEKLYDALIVASTVAARALSSGAGAATEHEARFTGIETRLAAIEARVAVIEARATMLTWAMGINLALTLAVLARVLTK